MASLRMIAPHSGGDYDRGGHDAAVRDFRIFLATVVTEAVAMVGTQLIFISDGGGTTNESQPQPV